MELIPAVDITIPGWLAWVTEFVNMGQAWPGPPASETACWHDANDLRDTANAVKELIAEVKQYRRRATQADVVLTAALVGDTAGTVDAQFSELVDGLQNSVEALGKSADLLDATGSALQDAKISMLTTLGIAAATIAWALATADFSLGGSLAEIPIVEVFAENALREAWSLLVDRVETALAEAIARTVGERSLAEVSTKALVWGLTKQLVIKDALTAVSIGMIPQLAAQGFLVLEGYPESAGTFGKQLAQAAWSMAVMGVIGGVTGHLVGPVFGGVLGTQGTAGLLGRALTGVSSATAANVAGTLAGGGQVGLGTFTGGLLGLAHGAGGEHGAVPEGTNGVEPPASAASNAGGSANDGAPQAHSAAAPAPSAQMATAAGDHGSELAVSGVPAESDSSARTLGGTQQWARPQPRRRGGGPAAAPE